MPEERRRNEKEEKAEEKKHEKEEEKGRGWDEKWRRDRGNAVTWAAVLIWGALVLLAETTGYARIFNWWIGWAVFLTGFGIIILITAIIRSIIPEHRRAVGGSLILGCILLGVGLGGLIGWGYVWPVILIAIALIILIRAFSRGRRL